MLTKPTTGLLFLAMLVAGVLGGAELAAAVEVGQKAPDFKLPATTGEDISLSQFRGKKHVLLEFFVADWAAV